MKNTNIDSADFTNAGKLKKKNKQVFKFIFTFLFSYWR